MGYNLCELWAAIRVLTEFIILLDIRGQHQTCDADLNVMPSEHVSSLLALISDAQVYINRIFTYRRCWEWNSGLSLMRRTLYRVGYGRWLVVELQFRLLCFPCCNAGGYCTCVPWLALRYSLLTLNGLNGAIFFHLMYGLVRYLISVFTCTDSH